MISKTTDETKIVEYTVKKRFISTGLFKFTIKVTNFIVEQLNLVRPISKRIAEKTSHFYSYSLVYSS